MEIVYTQLENMLFKSLLASKKALFAESSSSSSSSGNADDRVTTFVDVLSAHFLSKDGYFKYQAGETALDAYEAAHQIVLRSLPAVFPNLKQYAPSWELVKGLLDAIHTIPFTENTTIMRIVS